MVTRNFTGPNQSIQVRVERALLSGIETFRRTEPDIPTRPEAVRRLLHRALDLVGSSNAIAKNDGAAA